MAFISRNQEAIAKFKAEKAADASAYAEYYRRCNAETDVMLMDRELLYVSLRKSGLTADEALDAVIEHEGVKTLDLKSYNREEIDGETFEQIAADISI